MTNAWNEKLIFAPYPNQEHDFIKPKLYRNFSELDLKMLPKENLLVGSAVELEWVSFLTWSIDLPISFLTASTVSGFTGIPDGSVTWKTFTARDPLVVTSARATDRPFSLNIRVTSDRRPALSSQQSSKLIPCKYKHNRTS